jgi:hypothetical protein
MAIARGAGTEIIRTIHVEAVNDSASECLIFGVAHHIYTVLSITVFASAVGASGDWVRLSINPAYDTKAGVAGEIIYIFEQGLNSRETFVWNDKFSFNGAQPTDFTATLDSAVKQDAIADQGGSAQKLMVEVQNSSCNFDISCTYIDQNNA